MKTKKTFCGLLKVCSLQLILWFSVCITWNANANANETPTNASVDQEASVKVRKDARGRKVQYVDFGDALIEGKAKTPDGFVIQSRTSGKFDSLIELRKDFRDKISLNALETITLTAPAD